ncbi:MAG: hypothetical protein ACOCP9_02050 [Halofilum sp. (in: g-proteobacteria)]
MARMVPAPAPHGTLPTALKIGFTVFVLLWTPLVLATRGWQNFLWLCDLANFLILIGLWLESRLLLSSQLVATLLIGLAWTLDLVIALVTGLHPFAATAYMFDPGLSVALRLSSLFHMAAPLLLLFAVARLGHDRRGWRLQTLICWAVLPLSAWLTDTERNINWVEAPFHIEQIWLPDWLYVLACMLVYPLLLYLPTEAVLRRLLPIASPWRQPD